MKKELNYSDAFSKLEELVEELEEGNIPLDKLTPKVKQANELITICETKLRKIETEVNDATNTTTIQHPRKK
jgi:exodeoxyribonuclease VII small subunit